MGALRKEAYRTRRRLRAAGVAAVLLVGTPFGAGAAGAPSTPATAPTRAAVDPAARMLDGGAAGEFWDVRARLEGGASFFARFWVTNEGPGSHTGIAMGTLLGPDGERADFRYGRERSAWTLAGANRYVEIASAVLDLRAPVGRVELDTNRQGIKVYLRFPIPHGSQAPCTHRDATGGFDVLALAAPIDGIAWTKELAAPIAARGTIDVTHGWSTESEIDSAHRRIEVTARHDDVAVYASALIAPNGARRTCTAVVQDDRLVYESRHPTVTVGPTALAGSDPAYPVPARIRVRDQALDLLVEPARRLLELDPLEAVPQPFRLLLGLRSRPRRTWSEGSWRLRLDGNATRAPLDLQGATGIAVSYSNPWTSDTD